jgi:hypothetical protein
MRGPPPWTWPSSERVRSRAPGRTPPQIPRTSGQPLVSCRVTAVRLLLRDAHWPARLACNRARAAARPFTIRARRRGNHHVAGRQEGEGKPAPLVAPPGLQELPRKAHEVTADGPPSLCRVEAVAHRRNGASPRQQPGWRQCRYRGVGSCQALLARWPPDPEQSPVNASPQERERPRRPPRAVRSLVHSVLIGRVSRSRSTWSWVVTAR